MQKKSYIVTGLFILMLFAVVLSVCIGAVQISFSELVAIIGHRVGWGGEEGFNQQQEAVLFSLRMPRVVLGLLVGAALGISGAVMQGLFRNPLAEPGLIGISSGASAFAASMIVFGSSFLSTITGMFGYYSLSIAAFAGACVTAFVVYRAAMYKGKTDVTTLLLVGIAANALSNAFVGVLTYISTEEELRNITFWSLGSLGGASWSTVSAILPFVLVPLVCLPFYAKPLNAFALGEAQASHMGVRVNRVKIAIIVLATMGVGASVAVSGVIVFVGLVIPHMVRMIGGADHKLVIPGSALLGASVLTLSDLVARTMVSPAELPIGILTAFIGAPVFLFIIFRERSKRRL